MANIFDTITREDQVTTQANNNVDNYLDFLNKAEGSPKSNTIVGGGKFDDYSKHPGVVGVTTKEGPSTAAGKWQITKTTYDDIAPKIGVTDFSEESQKKIALKLIKDKGALEDIQKGDYQAANAKLGSVWASLPSSPYSQSKRSPEWVEGNLKASMTAENAVTRADEAQPQQVLDRLNSTNTSSDKTQVQEKVTSNNIFDQAISGNIFDQAVSGKPSTKRKTSSYPGYVPFEGGDAEKAFVKSAVGTAAKLIPALPAMTLGAQGLGTLGTIYGGVPGGIAGAIVGGVGGLIAGEKAVEKLYDEFMPEKFKEFTGYDTETREKEIAESPKASRYGQYAGSTVLFRPGFISPIKLGSGKTISPLAQRAGLGVAGGAFEAGSELASGEKLSPEKIKEAAIFSAIAAKPTAITTQAEKLAANIMKKFKLPTLEEAMSDKTQPKTKTEEQFTLPDNPMPQDIANVAEAEARAGQVFTPEQEASIAIKDRPVKAIMQTLFDITKNVRESKIWRSTLEQMVPDVRNRENITMALEGQKSFDVLVNQETKRQRLYGDNETIIAAKEARAERRKALGLPRSIADRIDRGMVGARQVYRMMISEGLPSIERYNAKIAAKENPNTFTGFDRAWHNYNKSKGFPKEATPEAQLEFLKQHEKRLTSIVDRVEARPHDTPDTFKAMELVKNEFKRLDILSRIEGLYEKTRQNYVTHALNFKGSNLNRAEQIKISDWLFKNTNPRFFRDFAQARTIRYIRELESKLREAGDSLGIDTRGVIVEKDIAKIMQIYKDSMGKAQIEKRLVNYLTKIKLDGNKLLGTIKELPIITKDSKTAYEGNYVPFTGPGSEVLKGYKVHPDFADPLGHLFYQKDPLLLLQGLNSVSMLAKTFATTASLFHATSLFISKSTASPSLMLKEIFTRGAGSRQALQEFERNGASATVKQALDTGLGIKSDDVQLGSVQKLGQDIDNFINTYLIKPISKETGNVKLLSRGTDPLQEHFLNHLDKFTWEYMHTAGKLQLWQHYFTDIKTRHPEFSDQAIGEEVSKFVNNTMGGLNWLQIANDTQNVVLREFLFKLLKKENRMWSNVALFAPDWTVSTLRAFTTGLPKELLKPQNWELRKGFKGLSDPTSQADLARRYALFTLIGWATIYNGMNYALSGKYMWENKDPTRLDLNDGTTMQAAKHSMEAAHWVMHPWKTLSNKLGYFPKTILEISKDTTKGPVDVTQKVVEPFLPFQVSASVKAPKGEKLKRAVASFVGTPIYGQTNKQNTNPDVLMERKLKRKETARENKLEKLKNP
jgi:muramidase (phage lysozyme)